MARRNRLLLWDGYREEAGVCHVSEARFPSPAGRFRPRERTRHRCPPLRRTSRNHSPHPRGPLCPGGQKKNPEFLFRTSEKAGNRGRRAVGKSGHVQPLLTGF
ncbi:hypothetical protein TREES_T100005358 [Tupaia chinensis]|uniref:Uncharacterized protein n=1 Tax=Tupaia chinensis TaxID=246437 RepID=L9KRF5_TUPCH|nr:hypothetical protein TREES_T100005358 [Tupaia chinensis]